MKRIALVLLLCIAAGTAVAGSNKWRLQVSGGAESDGTITMTLALDDGQKLPVNVAIKKGTGENAVAKQIRDATGGGVADDGPIWRTGGTALSGSAFASSASAVMSSWTSLRISLTASSGANTSVAPVSARTADSDVIPALLRRSVGSVLALDSPRAACT